MILVPPQRVTCALMQAKGELRAAHAEIDELKEDKAVLGKALDVKAKEIRMQLLQVHLLASETRRHGATTICLYRALWRLFLGSGTVRQLPLQSLLRTFSDW